MDEDLDLKALELQLRGFNCAQAVASVFAPYVGVKESLLYKLSEALGRGMGSYDEICGAISGGLLILSYLSSDYDKIGSSKEYTYTLAQSLITQFKNKNKSSICRDLKGLDNNIVLRSCEGCIIDAVNLTKSIIEKERL